MIKIQKLAKPSKKTGYELMPKMATTVRGLTIVNNNTFPVYIDKWTRKKKK